MYTPMPGSLAALACACTQAAKGRCQRDAGKRTASRELALCPEPAHCSTGGPTSTTEAPVEIGGI